MPILQSLGVLARAQTRAPAPDSRQPKATGHAVGSTTSIRPKPQDTTGQTVVNADGSGVRDNHFRNPYFGFAVDFPQGWLRFSNEDRRVVMDQNKRKMMEGHPDLATVANRPNVSAPLLAVAEANAYKDYPNEGVSRFLPVMLATRQENSVRLSIRSQSPA